MGDPFRELPPPTRAEYVALEERVTALEKLLTTAVAEELLTAAPPQEPFELLMWHALVGGVAAMFVGIIGIGWLYDNVHDTGMRISAIFACVLLILVGLIVACATVFNLDSKRHLKSPWRA